MHSYLRLQISEVLMKSKLMTYFESVLLYEIPEVQEKARQVMPIQELNEQARSRLASANKDCCEKPLDFQVGRQRLGVYFMYLQMK